ncbi:hypothetical protein [Brevundimonas sp.]|uniref:hypothetical protein n=1 Tax=Brevundimonas sp. TaxID=1871086 RepID=UPI003564AC8B
MAGPGDPTHPDDHDDDLIGFVSPASLQGRARDVSPPEPEARIDAPPGLLPETEEPMAAAPPQPEPEPVLPNWSASVTAHKTVEPVTGVAEADRSDPVEAPAAEPLSLPLPLPLPKTADADGLFAPSPEFATRTRRRGQPSAIPGGGMSLFVVYALILFAVPTLGVSVLIGLLAVTGRDGHDDALSRSHFIYQQRTLWTAAVVAGAGPILLAAPLALGVPILFGLALWLVARGASGVWALKAGRPITDPRGWWI